MAGKGIMDRFQSLPKWGQVGVGVLLVGALGFGFWYFGIRKPKPEEEPVPKTVTPNMPDAADSYVAGSRLDEYRMDDYRGQARTGNAVEDYWNSLGDNLVSKEPLNPYIENDLENGNYTELEKYQIRNGVRTRQEIDAQHAADAAAADDLAARLGSTARQAPMTQEQKDSAYFARLERAYEMAARYAAPADGAEPGASAQQLQQQEEEMRRIDLESAPASLPVDSFGGDGIITSLDASPAGASSAGAGRRPVKATFLKNETLFDGQRVIMRLMEDLRLSDGTLIPANTHITGTCSIGRRLRIDVSMVNYGGRMFPADVSVYDNDGTEGIYFPDSGKKKKLEKIAGDVGKSALQAGTSILGGLLVGSPGIGLVASRGLSSITSNIDSDGSVKSINVTAGYEFYMFENTKK